MGCGCGRSKSEAMTTLDVATAAANEQARLNALAVEEQEKIKTDRAKLESATK